MALDEIFGKMADRVAKAAGHPITFLSCCILILLWALSGPVFHYSDTWQLVINTGTTIITFLMVFLIQNTQNRDSAALQMKLDELIRSSAAQNAFIGIEHLSQADVEKVSEMLVSRRAAGRAAVEKAVNGGREQKRDAADKA